jgi:glycosyltransferase involved in cell wall biosynthesis
MTLVSVITPTWQRHQLLLNRCIPSVWAQTYPNVQHVVCSDGPDPVLRGLLADADVTYAEAPHHDEHRMNFGSRARNNALARANGDYIAYLDDDNAWRPDHLDLLVKALDDNPAAGFAYSKLITHPQGTVIGADRPMYGGIDTSVIVHRRELLELARWPKPGEIVGDQHAPDWAIVEAWLAKGAGWVHIPAITVDYHFAGS